MSTTTTSDVSSVTPTTDRAIPTRRISFEEALQELPKHFAHDGDLILSHLAANLSAVFPDGEDFFVRSVRHYRKGITDPEMKANVAGFIGQEAMHGREHRMFNDRLDQLGYPTKRIERFTKWGLANRAKIAPPISNLAATAALEHFTATLAELILTSEDARDLFGDEAVANLFFWHALEESEHKAVAFDLYKQVGGSERLRVWTMKFTRTGFVVGLALQMMLSLLGDRETYRKGKLRKSWKHFRSTPLVSSDLWAQLKDYDRPDFHPNDRDTTALVVEWRERLFGENGTLNDLLVGSAA
ncbi:MAG: metal-dependent hydrolase [Aquihabitans sp.]